MARATGHRLAAAACFLLGLGTIIGIPIFWPLAYVFAKTAKEKEEDRERELDALDAQATRAQRDPAIDRLREQYAAGELTDEEFQSRRTALVGADSGSPIRHRAAVLSALDWYADEASGGGLTTRTKRLYKKADSLADLDASQLGRLDAVIGEYMVVHGETPELADARTDIVRALDSRSK